MTKNQTQVVLTELRDILPTGTVVTDPNGVEWTRGVGTWHSVTGTNDHPSLPLTIIREAHKSTVPDDFWHLDGHHRTTAPDANGRNVQRFEDGIRHHLETCRRIPPVKPVLKVSTKRGNGGYITATYEGGPYVDLRFGVSGPAFDVIDAQPSTKGELQAELKAWLAERTEAELDDYALAVGWGHGERK